MKMKRGWKIAGFSLVSVALVGITIALLFAYSGQKEEKKSETAQVVFSKTTGVYEKSFNLELSTSMDVIYYTIDGSNPVTSETRVEYTKPVLVSDRKNDPNVMSAVDPVLFDAANAGWDSSTESFYDSAQAPLDSEVDKIMVVKAVSADEQGNYSQVQSNTYFVGSMEDHIQGIQKSCKAAGQDLAILSLTTDADNFFDSKKGIYVRGDVFDQSLKAYLKKHPDEWIGGETARSLDANYKQRGKEWERPVTMTLFESDGTNTHQVMEQDCGIRVQGNYSRSDLQKGLRLCAGEEYGAKNFEYAFFGDRAKDDQGKTIDKFKKLTLRNGGNCAFSTKFSDTYWQSLMTETACETQASRPCVVYLNGEYWGVYIMQEDYNDKYFEETHGVDNKTVVAYKGDAETYQIGYKLDEGDLPLGEKEDYYFQELLDFYKTHKDLTSQADYDAFEKLVDIDSVRDYFAINVWINNKWDWPGKNWTAWKVTQTDSENPYADGRWRLCLYDLDFGGVSGESDIKTNTIEEDNYQKGGLLDRKTKNPVVLMYVYLMTNPQFRRSFYDRVNEFTETIFEKDSAKAACKTYREIYEPLLTQFYARYVGSTRAEGRVRSAMEGGYASYQCIINFLNKRAKYIQPMLDWVESYYSMDTKAK